MKKLFVVLMLLCCTAFLFGCSGGSDTTTGTTDDQTTVSEGQKVILKIGHVEAEDRSTHKALVNFKDRVEAESNGNISIEIYPNGSLGDDAEMVTAVSLGTLQMTLPATGNMTSYSDKWGVFDIPFLFKSPDAAFAAVDGEIGQYLNALLDGTGMVSLGFTYNGVRCMTNNVRPINEPADCEGIKFRIMDSPVFRSFFECLGANPTPISFSEVYTSLQNGVVDGEENAASLIYAMKFNEVQKYFSDTQHVYSFLPVVVNQAWYEGLDETNKAIIDKNVPIMVAEQREMEVSDNEKYIQLLKDSGVEVNYITPENHDKFVEAVQPLYDEYKVKFGQEIFDLAAKYNQEN